MEECIQGYEQIIFKTYKLVYRKSLQKQKLYTKLLHILDILRYPGALSCKALLTNWFLKGIVTQSLNNILQAIIPPEHQWKLTLFKHWDEIIGDMRDKVIIQEIKDSVLFLAVSHPAWAHELFLLTPLLKQKINSYLVKDQIKTIRLNVKTFQSAGRPRKKVYDSGSASIVNVPPSIQEQALLSRIANHELRDALGGFLLRCKRQKKE